MTSTQKGLFGMAIQPAPEGLIFSANELLVFIDDTGHEAFAPGHPAYGLGGCAVVSQNYRREICEPWELIRRQVTGSPKTPLHASKFSRKATEGDIDAVAGFFCNQRFFRIGVTISNSTNLDHKFDVLQTMKIVMELRLNDVLTKTFCKTVRIVFEASERMDNTIAENFSTLSGGLSTATRDVAGGELYAYGGGVASTTVVSSGGRETDLSGGTVRNTTVSSGGALVVSSGGVASNTVVSSGGREYVSSGGIDRNMILSSGGAAFIVSGGTVSGGKVISGATLTISSGGVVSANLTLSGGLAVLSGSMASGQSVDYVGAGGELALFNTAAFGATISGFGTGDLIDLTKLTYSSTGTRSFAEASSHTSGTLTVTEGGSSVHLTLLGNYTTSAFALSKDGGTGTLVKFV